MNVAPYEIITDMTCLLQTSLVRQCAFLVEITNNQVSHRKTLSHQYLKKTYKKIYDIIYNVHSYNAICHRNNILF